MWLSFWEKRKNVSLGVDLGALLVAGESCVAKKFIFDSYATDSVERGYDLLIIRGNNSPFDTSVLENCTPNTNKKSILSKKSNDFIVDGSTLLNQESILEMVSESKAVEIILDFDSENQRDAIIFKGCIEEIFKLVCKKPQSKLAVIIDGVTNKIFEMARIGMLLGNRSQLKIAYSVNGIVDFVNAISSCRGLADTYLFLRQTEKADQEYCSCFFGEVEPRGRLKSPRCSPTTCISYDYFFFDYKNIRR